MLTVLLSNNRVQFLSFTRALPRCVRGGFCISSALRVSIADSPARAIRATEEKRQGRRCDGSAEGIYDKRDGSAEGTHDKRDEIAKKKRKNEPRREKKRVRGERVDKKNRLERDI